MPTNQEPNPHTGQRGHHGIGRWMIYGAWVLLLLLLTLLFSQWLDRQNNPNRQLIDMATQNGVAELVLKRNRAGHYLVPGTINGVEVDFLLDTGATYVAVPQSIAEKAGLNRLARTQSMTANGLTPSWLSEIAEVRIGPITMRDVRAAILPSMPGNEVLLGMSFLKHLKLEQQGDSLKLTLP